jgi:ADP-heptose:LPS heptosyltransferase
VQIDKNKISKILIIKFGGIGDLLLTTPVLPNLREAFPNAMINYLTMNNSRDILIDNRYINRVITYEPEEDGSLFLIRKIRKQKYDLIIDLFCNPRTALITYLSRAKYRFGYEFKGRKYAYNIMTKGRGGEIHNVEFNLDSLRRLEIPIKSKYINLSFNVVHEEFADKFYSDNNLTGNSVGICATGGWESKKYKIKDYVDIINSIYQKHNVNFILFWGSEQEKQDCYFIRDNSKPKCILIPESPLKYMAAILKKCKAVISNDSGPLHIAVAVGTPVLGIYGPTNPFLQGPFGDKNLSVVNEKLDCLACNLLNCSIGNVCMTELSKDKILNTFENLIKINNIILNDNN